MQLSDPAVVSALALAGGVVLAEGRQWIFGGRQNKAQLAEIEQRIAEGLLIKLDERLKAAEERIVTLERQVHELQSGNDRLERELAIVTAERDQLLAERDQLLDRISVLQPPPQPERAPT